MATDISHDSALTIGSHALSSRLIVGTGKYASYELMQQSLARSGTDCITVAVRRERSAVAGAAAFAELLWGTVPGVVAQGDVIRVECRECFVDLGHDAALAAAQVDVAPAFLRGGIVHVALAAALRAFGEESDAVRYLPCFVE